MQSEVKSVLIFVLISILTTHIIPISATNTSETNSTLVGRLIVIVSDDMHGWTQSASYQYAIGTNTEKNSDGAIYYGLKFNNELYSSYSQNIGGKIVNIVGTVDDARHTVIVESMLWPVLNSTQKQTPSITADHISKQKNICPLDSIEYYGRFSGHSENIYKFFVMHAHSYLKHCKSEGYAMPSPLNLLKAQVPVNEIFCNDNLILLLRPSTNSPVCVKPQSALKLVNELGYSAWHSDKQSFDIIKNDSKSSLASSSPGKIFITSLSISNVPTLGQTAEVTVHGQYHAADTWPKDAQADVPVVIGIPEGFEIVNGADLSLVEEFDYLGYDYKRFSKNFTGSLSNPFVLSVTVRAVQTGNWTIGGSVLDGADYLYITVGEHDSYINNEQFPLPPRKSGITE